ncbi:MAG: DUF2934 domain-containing protein [Steroidobacteraceae bacterium]
MPASDDSHIQSLAHQIWEEQGKPHGRHDEHWHEAERRLAAAKPVEETPAGKAAGLEGDSAGTGSQQDAPGRPKSASNREQTHAGQSTQTGSAELDGQNARPAKQPARADRR